MRKSREADEAKKTRTAGEIVPEEIWDIYIQCITNFNDIWDLYGIYNEF